MVLRITPRQRTKINALVRRACCNCRKGNCLLLDDGEEVRCVQLISRYGIYCNYFLKAVLPAEKAFAYKLKYAALKHQGTSSQLETKFRTDEEIARDSGESRATVQRYIRLTHLIPELLALMDENKMALSVGVELSFLGEQSQREVLEQCGINDCTPSYAQAVRMRKAHNDSALTAGVIRKIMGEEKANQRETVKIPTEKLRKFAPNADPRQLEEFVLKACEHYDRSRTSIYGYRQGLVLFWS